jgi:hypothetical protein
MSLTPEQARAKGLIDIAEAAQRLGVSPSIMRRLVCHRAVPCVRGVKRRAWLKPGDVDGLKRSRGAA